MLGLVGSPHSLRESLESVDVLDNLGWCQWINLRTLDGNRVYLYPRVKWADGTTAFVGPYT